MACGLPVVAAESGAVAEILRRGEEGLIAEATPEGFSEALLRLLKNPQERLEMGRKAKIRAEEFSSANCVRRMLEIYQKVLDKAG
jgi:glycosyltransferase involved in cell wall biosynthesis